MADIIEPPRGKIAEKNGNPTKAAIDFFWSIFNRSPLNGSFTLTASTTSTVVTDKRVNSTSVILLMATTATAAAEMDNIYIAPGREQFTVTHSNTSDTDKTFNYTVV